MVPSLRGSRRSLAVILILTALVAAACGAASSGATNAPRAPDIVKEPGSAGQGQGGLPAATAGGPAGGNQAGGGDQAGGTPPSTDQTSVLPDGTRIVYNGTLSLHVPDLDAAVRDARQVVAKVGGFLSGSRQDREGSNATASVTYRIPAERWEETLE